MKIATLLFAKIGETLTGTVLLKETDLFRDVIATLFRGPTEAIKDPPGPGKRMIAALAPENSDKVMELSRWGQWKLSRALLGVFFTMGKIVRVFSVGIICAF